MEFIDNVSGDRFDVDSNFVTTKIAVDFLQRKIGIDEIKKNVNEPEAGFELATSSLQKMRSTN